MKADKRDHILLIKQAVKDGARQAMACSMLNISAKTFQRWNKSKSLIDGRTTAIKQPSNALSEFERARILKVANEQEYADLSPAKIVPALADKGIYIASESSFYRVLKSEGQLTHRVKSNPPKKVSKPKALTATRPNQIYSWDITYLPTNVKGIFLYLYLVMDVYSRKIVGWQVYESESSAYAADLMTDICDKEQIEPDQVILHSDNGSPMKGATMLATLQQLGIAPSFSRPSVSNDNPYSESLFRTLKYRPEYPAKPFDGLKSTRDWVKGFVHWYNCEHLHSSIKYVTPEQRHKGLDMEILNKRKQVYLAAQKKNPNRWSKDIRNWDMIENVCLNPDKSDHDKPNCEAA